MTFEKTARRLVLTMENGFYDEEVANKPGFLQQLDPRCKIVGFLGLTVAASWAHRAATLAALTVLAAVLIAGSRIPLRAIALRVWLPVLAVSGALVFPAIFLTPGDRLWTLPLLGWATTQQGVQAAVRLLWRVEAATTFSALLVLTTPWMHVLKGLRVLRIPIVAVVLLSMTYRYIFLLVRTAREMFEARESRRAGKFQRREARRIAAATAGVLLSKTMQLGEEVYFAMRSRGYQGEVYLLETFRMRSVDWAAAAVLLSAASAALWLG